MKKLAAAVIVGCVLGFGTGRCAASSWTLTTADFQSRQVDVVAMDAEGVTLSGRSGTERVPMSSVLELTRDAGNAAVRQGAYVLTLSGGDRVSGKLAEIAGETLTWDSPAVGKITVPLKDVRAVTKAASSATVPDQPPAEDTVTLANGDVVKGIVSGMDSGKVSVAQSGGDTIPVPADSISSLVFAAGAKPPATKLERGFRVVLADGSALTGPALTIGGAAGDLLTLKMSDGSGRQIQVGGVAGIEQVNGPVTFLSSLRPVEDVQRPYLGDPWPTRYDKTVTGQPLRVAGEAQVVPHGIGVHSYSKLTFTIDGGTYKTFRTRYAIEGGGPLANVTVRVLVDGRVAHEREDVTATTPVGVVNVPVAGAKTLTLEVDYGRGNDVQDRFEWLDPALIR